MSTNKVILRKKIHRSDAHLKPEDIQKIIYDYTYCHKTVSELSEEYRVDARTLQNVIANFQNDMNNIHETYSLIREQKKDMSSDVILKSNRRIVHPEIINKKFLDLLSGDNDTMLTDAEATYAYVLVYTSNNTKAIQEAKLDIGLLKPRTKDSKVSYENSIKLRGYFLRGKPNVQKYIMDLRERKLKDTHCDKEYVQSTLITEIENMQEEHDPRNKSNLLRAVELLGKTIPGCFSETIKVEEVSPDKALDALLERAKETIKNDNGTYETIPD